MAPNINVPVMRSVIATPIFIGPDCFEPVMLIRPLAAETKTSYANRSRSGPLRPKPVMLA